MLRVGQLVVLLIKSILTLILCLCASVSEAFPGNFLATSTGGGGSTSGILGINSTEATNTTLGSGDTYCYLATPTVSGNGTEISIYNNYNGAERSYRLLTFLDDGDEAIDTADTQVDVSDVITTTGATSGFYSTTTFSVAGSYLTSSKYWVCTATGTIGSYQIRTETSGTQAKYCGSCDYYTTPPATLPASGFANSANRNSAYVKIN